MLIRWGNVNVKDAHYSADGTLHEVNYASVTLRVSMNGNKQRSAVLMPVSGAHVVIANVHVDTLTESQVVLHGMREERDPNTPEKIIRKPVIITAT